VATFRDLMGIAGSSFSEAISMAIITGWILLALDSLAGIGFLPSSLLISWLDFGPWQAKFIPYFAITLLSHYIAVTFATRAWQSLESSPVLPLLPIWGTLGSPWLAGTSYNQTRLHSRTVAKMDSHMCSMRLALSAPMNSWATLRIPKVNSTTTHFLVASATQ